MTDVGKVPVRRERLVCIARERGAIRQPNLVFLHSLLLLPVADHEIGMNRDHGGVQLRQMF